MDHSVDLSIPDLFFKCEKEEEEEEEEEEAEQ